MTNLIISADYVNLQLYILFVTFYNKLNLILDENKVNIYIEKSYLSATLYISKNS